MSEASTTRSPFSPCSPDQFSGRFEERNALPDIFKEVKMRGYAVMVSGGRGLGKSSFLNWVAHEIQTGDNPVIMKEFSETPGMIFLAFQEMLVELKGQQKCGWFRKALQNPKIQRSIDACLELVKAVSPLVVPGSVPIRTVASVIEIGKDSLGGRPTHHYQVLTSFLDLFDNLSELLIEKDRYLALMLDDVQWSSDQDFWLLKDLIRNLPQRIMLIFAFRREPKYLQKYNEINQEMVRLQDREFCLDAMSCEEVRDIAEVRYGYVLDEKTVNFLHQNIGDPLGLIVAFDHLQKKGVTLTLSYFEEFLPEIVESARCVYMGLDELWQSRVNSLCILHSPLPLSLIACMLKIETSQLAQLQNEFNRSAVFTRKEKGLYDFSHPSLREYRRGELPEEQATELHGKAAQCYERLRGRSEIQKVYDFAMADHLFYGGQYKESLELNLQLSQMLDNHYEFHQALEYIKRAVICAEKINDKIKLGISLHFQGVILESLYNFSEALEYYDESLEIEREIGDRAGEAMALHQMGMVHEETNQFEKALEYYDDSLKIEREIGDRAGEAMALHQMGMVHEETNQFEKALEYYDDSLKIEREIGDRASEATTLHQMGNVYYRTNQFEKALEYYDESLKIEREIGDRATEAMTLHQIGRVHEDINQFEKALEYYNESLKIAEETGNTYIENIIKNSIERVKRK